MSITKNITTYPDTKRTFDSRINTLRNISGFFLVPKGLILTTSDDDIIDYDYWFETLLNDGNVIPVHGVKNFTPEDEELITNFSLQRFTYEIAKGKYRHSLEFVFTNEFHQILESYSGTDLSIVYYDKNRNLILMTGYQGIPTSSIILKKQEFPTSGTKPKSVIQIELKDTSDYNENGVVKAVEWNPEDIDRLFVAIELNATSTQLTAGITRDGSVVTGLLDEDFTILDDANGEIAFSLFSYGGGVYTFSGLSSTLTGGCFTLSSTLYLGRNAYRVVAAITYDVREHFESGDYEMFESGDYELFNT